MSSSSIRRGEGYEEGYEEEDMRQRSPADERADDNRVGGVGSTRGGDDGVELSTSNLNPLNPSVVSPLHMSSSQRSR